MDKIHALMRTFQDHEVRIQREGTDLLFCAGDVYKVLGYANERQPLKNNVNEKYLKRTIRGTDGIGRTREMTFLAEPGLYQLVCHSKKPAAEAFQDWLFEEVLPSIRQHGGFHIDPAIQKQLENLSHNRLGQFLRKLGLTTESKNQWFRLGYTMAKYGCVEILGSKPPQFVVTDTAKT